MINFTIGPVQSSEYIREIGGQQVPYFRTPEFSEVMKENEIMMKQLAGAAEDTRTVFLTGSGTASMESVVMHVLNPNDKVLIINGGSFGQRFVDLCTFHEISYDEVKLERGKTLTNKDLAAFKDNNYSALLVNHHETSTGVLYDIKLLSEFCKEKGILFIVDAISSFLADEIEMAKMGIDVLITGSQKALACPPGISIILLSPKALKRVDNNKEKSMYLSIKSALKNGERGQTPFTPAVSILLQINARLKSIIESGGLEAERKKIKAIADMFRDGIKGLPLKICSEALSNAMTPVETMNCSAYDIFNVLKDEYGIWICPNGGDLKDKIFRVGHIGDIKNEENQKLLDALKDLAARNILI